MRETIADLTQLLRSMAPVLNAGCYVFACLPPGTDATALQPLATFNESEGLTLIVEEQRARTAGLPALFRAAWITLSVHSDLQAVGLTAAVAAALTRADIPCNIVAAASHDHVFVPFARADDALEVLQELQRSTHSPA